jgi:ADP-heptose:LPS heptosyltransferase
MGFGDELMAVGQARKMNETDPRRVQIFDRFGAARWHPVFENNSRLARPGEEGDFQQLHNGPGNRPYILGTADDHWTWRDFECTPGEIFFTQAEKQFASAYRPQIIIEPTLKSRASPNKQWGLERWQQFAKLAKKAGYGLTQLGAPGTRPLQYANMISTPDFRHAAAVLANAKAYVGHEGGLHHAAAALGIPAVVIFGGFISPAQTGYATHRNLYAGGTPCGNRTPCEHCKAAMAAITPQHVLNELMRIL